MELCLLMPKAKPSLPTVLLNKNLMDALMKRKFKDLNLMRKMYQ